jgi:transcriptional regulator GlxA family with amidase domain
VENLIEIRRRLQRQFSGEIVITPSEVVVSSAEADFLEQVREVVETCLGEANFGVERLAEDVGLSVRQFHRKMKELTKLTPAGYIRMMRLERAAQLLVQQAGNVSEVAYAVGFQDAYYFSRLFKQTFGLSPSKLLNNPDALSKPA